MGGGKGKGHSVGGKWEMMNQHYLHLLFVTDFFSSIFPSHIFLIDPVQKIWTHDLFLAINLSDLIIPKGVSYIQDEAASY